MMCHPGFDISFFMFALETQTMKNSLNEQRGNNLYMTQEVGSSSWLGALSLRTKSFSLNKKGFIDVIT